VKASPLQALRWRVVTLAAIGVVIALACASVFVVASVRHRLTAGVDEEIERRTDEVASRLRTNALPARIGTSGDPQDAVVQVVVGGTIVAVTDNAVALEPLTRSCGSGPDVVEFSGIDNSPYRVVTTCIEVDGRVHAVHVAVNRDDVDESVRALRVALALAVPAVAVVLSIALWLLVGRLLVRVEASAVREARFVADAAHELRSPLARMITTLEVDGPASTEKVLHDARDLAHLTDDLLTLARLDSTTPLRPRPVDLDDVVFRVVHASRLSAGPVVIDVGGVSAAQVSGDERLLERVVTNLLDNAVRFARTRVIVLLGVRGDEVELVVADDGPGVAAEVATVIFDRFARGDDVRTPGTGGSGLGLAIVRAIVDAHGGTVDLEPSPAGARFRVRLPSPTRN
jgi:signal transduction histidine kinase